jgi:hypothetical protein
MTLLADAECIPQLDSIDVEHIPQLDSRDPTGTADLRADFERELKDRWQRLDRYLSNAVATSDVLSLSPNGAMALIPAADRTRQFRSWLDELLSHLIVSGGDWMKPYLDEAGERASSRAAGLDPRKDAGGVLPTAPRIAGHTTDAAEDEPRDDHGRWTALGSTISGVIASDPNRLTHGNTKHQAFFITRNGESVSWDKVKWGDTDLKGATSVHSHLPENYSSRGADKISETFSGADLETFAKQAREFGITKHAVITSPTTMDVLEMSPKFVSSGLNGAKLRKVGEASYEERADYFNKNKNNPDMGRYANSSVPFFREKMRIVAPKIGINYATDIPVNLRANDSALADSATEDTIFVLATSELQGICDAYAQQATRIAAHAALVRWRPAKAAQGIRQLTATVGLARSRMMADYLIVKAFGCATLEAFREAGVRHVGTVAETLPHAHLDDAARKTTQHRHPVHGRFITKTEATREWGRRPSGKFGKAPKVYNRSIAHRRALRTIAGIGEEEINVQTAGDDKVCAKCQAISDNGPYPIDEAMDLIPAHPRCRCVYVPSGAGKGVSNL